MKALPLLLIAGVAAPAAAAPAPMPVTRNAVERRAAQMFTAADIDRDGWLTRTEYQSAVVAQARRYDPAVPTTGKGMDAAMAQFDELAKPHEDGRIPRSAFVAAATAKFDSADLNHDGTVTPEEAREAGAIRRREAPAPRAKPPRRAR